MLCTLCIHWGQYVSYYVCDVPVGFRHAVHHVEYLVCLCVLVCLCIV